MTLFARLLFAAAAMLVTFGAAAAEEDVEGSRDHPLVGRYDGSYISYYKHSDFDEAALLKAPHDYTTLLDENRPPSDRSGEEWLKLEGSVTDIRYAIPPGRSSLEVLRNFTKSLAAQGFEEVFACADRACLVGRMNDPYILGTQIDVTNGVSTAYFDRARYVLMSRSGAETEAGQVYVSILTGEHNAEVTGFVRVVEPQGMEADKIVFIAASDMEDAIEASGKIDLYGILFDQSKATLKPESGPTLAEIGKLMTDNPDLRLEIVGHTDNVGPEDANLDLSNRRAARVVEALGSDYGIGTDRLEWSGEGEHQPVAPNDTEEDRAKNRRVELRAK